MNWIKSESTEKPETVDTTSSKTSVYLRRGIKETIHTDEESGDETTYYEYEEAKMSHAEYEEYQRIADVMNIIDLIR